MSSNIIKQIRESCGVTRADLARAIHVSPAKVYDLEHDRRGLKEEDLNSLSGFFAEKIETAYVAGLFDRASSVTITKIKPYKVHDYQVSPAYIARINFTSKHKLLCSIIKEVMGVGAVCVRKEKTRTYWSYYAHCAAVDTVVEKLLPYLRLKREKFLVLKEFRELLENSSSGWVHKIVQQPGVKEWWTIRETVEKLGFSNINYLLRLCNTKQVSCRKEFFGNQFGIWKIAPITNLSELKSISRDGLKVPDDVLDQYEELYWKIRLV